MSLLLHFFQAKLFLSDLFISNKVWMLFKMGCYLVIACITLQSVFLMAASLESNENVEQFSEIVLPLNSIVSGHTYENTAGLAQAVIQDECLDCNRKSCQCCSTSIFTLSSVREERKVFELFFYRYQDARTDIFYELFLRPPKSYTFFNSLGGLQNTFNIFI